MTDPRTASASAGPVVTVEHLVKRFGDVTAVDDVSFELARGEVLGLLGPNGAGKTTILHILLGLTTSTGGRVAVLGMDQATHREAILERVNFSSAYVSLPYNLRLRENLCVFACYYGVRDPARKVAELLELFDLTSMANRMTGALSSGQLTRLNLAKAFLNDPEILLLDEPTASLDPDVADRMRHYLARLKKERGLSLIYTSHNMREVEETCDRVIFINKGKIVQTGTPKELLARFNETYLENVFINLARGGDLHARTAEAGGPGERESRGESRGGGGGGSGSGG